MLNLLLNGQISIFVAIIMIIALTISLCFHEFGHAYVAKLCGDDTAERAGRLTINPLVHIDPMGLLMVILVGFGYAKPVPTNPNNFNTRWAELLVSAAGPAMNLLVAIVAINAFVIGRKMGVEFLASPGAQFFFTFLALINLILMLFNLIPIGALDGHYILPYFLPRPLAQRYRFYNAKYGNLLLLSLIVLTIAGLPIFRVIWNIGQTMLPWIIFV